MPERPIIFPKEPRERRSVRAQKVATFLSGLDPNRAWELIVRPFKRTRSNQQNRYLWGVCYAELVKQLPGWDADDVHEYMLGECFGWETIEGMGRRRLRPLKRSARLNTQEFSDYVAFIQRRAAEHNVFIPDPDPEWWLHAEQKAEERAA